MMRSLPHRTAKRRDNRIIGSPGTAGGSVTGHSGPIGLTSGPNWIGRAARYFTIPGLGRLDGTSSGEGKLFFDAEKTATNNPTVEYVTEGKRFRVRVRHTVADPFEFWYPPIDYEWEYLMVADGGITARGLHDGAPSYEIFYEAPHSDKHVRTWHYHINSFWLLGLPMEEKDKSWCAPAASGGGWCPGFGTARWV